MRLRNPILIRSPVILIPLLVILISSLVILRSEESPFVAQDKLREESLPFQYIRPFTPFRVTTI